MSRSISSQRKEAVLKWVEENKWFLGPWEAELAKMAINGLIDYKNKEEVSGWVDAHIHLDRVFTYAGKYLPPGINLSEIADLPLEAKQDLVGFLHDGSAYTQESLRSRMEKQIKRSISIGTREIWAGIDVTPDIGLKAWEIAQKLKEKYHPQEAQETDSQEEKNEIDLRLGVYPLFGLKNPAVNPDRLDILKEAIPKADFILGLPEKDEEEGRIGFKGHINTLLELGFEHGKEVHLHADQKNSAHQRDSFRIIECLQGLTPEKLKWFINTDERPKLWLVHMISPSCYKPEKFSRLVDFLVNYNIGVIICPSAAISMRQLRSETAPIHNCIARVTELLRAGVPLSFGTDNVNDYLVPAGNGLILREISELSNSTRNYVLHVLAKVGMGIPLNNGDRAILARSLHEHEKACHSHQQWIQQEEEFGTKFNF